MKRAIDATGSFVLARFRRGTRPWCRADARESPAAGGRDRSRLDASHPIDTRDRGREHVPDLRPGDDFDRPIADDPDLAAPRLVPGRLGTGSEGGGRVPSCDVGVDDDVT